MQVTEMQKFESNKWKRQYQGLVDKPVEQVKLSYTAEGSVNWYHHFGKLLDIIS